MRTQSSSPRGSRWMGLAIPFVALALVGVSCAYFNTLYNAKTKYKDAVKKPRTKEGKLGPQAENELNLVIEKCQTMIGTWPKSRHVDDAMLLIANCLYHQDRYGEAVAQLDSLEIKHPETDLMAQARLLKGRALSNWGEHEEAISVLSAYLERWPDAKGRPDALYYLTISSIATSRYDEAVGYVAELEERYSGSTLALDAQIEAAALLSDAGLHERSAAIYEALNEHRLPVGKRYEVWMGLAGVYVETGRYEDALSTLRTVETLKLDAAQEAPERLLKGAAYEGADSTEAAVATYLDITRRFTRGEYAAESFYRLGEIYEAADSLKKAKTCFESVANAHARSERADEAIRRAGSISKLIKLAETGGDDSPESEALRQFMLAELQLTQFDEPEKAAELYQALLDDYPDSEYGPMAAYAVGYIYGRVLGDSLQALEAYRLLRSRYPETQQAQFAYLFLGAKAPPAPADSAAAAGEIPAERTPAQEPPKPEGEDQSE